MQDDVTQPLSQRLVAKMLFEFVTGNDPNEISLHEDLQGIYSNEQVIEDLLAFCVYFNIDDARMVAFIKENS
jgi:hypothetical protein